MPTYTPPPFFTAAHTFTTLSLTSLGGLMVFSPNLYHKHVIRSTNPSTTDLFISTQFTNATQGVFYSAIQSSGIMLLGTSIGLFATRHHPGSFTVMASVTASVAAGHAYMLRDVISSQILRRGWLQETDRVAKVGVVIGVNLLTAVVSLWAGLSYGGWPWRAVPVLSFAPSVHNSAPVRGGNGDLDIESVINGVVGGAVELAGGVGGLIKGFFSS